MYYYLHLTFHGLFCFVRFVFNTPIKYFLKGSKTSPTPFDIFSYIQKITLSLIEALETLIFTKKTPTQLTYFSICSQLTKIHIFQTKKRRSSNNLAFILICMLLLILLWAIHFNLFYYVRPFAAIKPVFAPPPRASPSTPLPRVLRHHKLPGDMVD